jgi:large-conductance mechanosensitive channel
LTNGGEIRIWSAITSLIFLVSGLLNSKFLTPFNKLWFRFGIFLGKIISPVIMGIIFFLVVTPIGLIMRLLGKDVLNLKYSENKSYWIEKDGPESKMKNQF